LKNDKKSSPYSPFWVKSTHYRSNFNRKEFTLLDSPSLDSLLRSKNAATGHRERDTRPPQELPEIRRGAIFGRSGAKDAP